MNGLELKKLPGPFLSGGLLMCAKAARKEVTLRECYFHPETPSRCRLTSTSFCFWLGSPGSPHFTFENGQVAPGRSKSKPAGAYCWKASASHLYGKADSGDTSPVGSSFPPWCS